MANANSKNQKRPTANSRRFFLRSPEEAGCLATSPRSPSTAATIKAMMAKMIREMISIFSSVICGGKKWDLPYLFMWGPIVLISCISVNFFLYGSTLGIFKALGSISFIVVCPRLMEDIPCNCRYLLLHAVSLSHISLLQHVESDITTKVSCFTTVLFGQFCPNA